MTLDRSVVVTGGGSGLGAAVARRLAGNGRRVAVIDLADTDNVAEHALIDFVPCDITAPDALDDAMASISRRLGPIDGLHANAGINGVQAPIADLTPDEWRTTLAVCLDGVFFTLRSALGVFAPEGGSVVVTSSITGTRSFATEGAAAYAAAKAGATALAQLAAVELGPLGIRVNVVAPGAVLDTRLLAERTVVRGLERLGHERRIDAALRGQATTSEDVADTVVHLLGPQSRRISGAVIHIDAAQSLLGGGVLKPVGTSPALGDLIEEVR